mgnify:CR=1 FL=1|jgi:hypothetical protein
MTKVFQCGGCSTCPRGCTLHDRNDWAAAPFHCPYDGGVARWREVVEESGDIIVGS